MKKLCFLLVAFMFSTIISAQDNFEISTLRIGPFHLKMDASEADKIGGKKLQPYDDYEKTNDVKYNGETISLRIYEHSDNSVTERSMASISTKSSKFKTKRGIGVGSTRNQVIEAYKDYANFNVYQGWDDEGNTKKDESYIELEDRDAHPLLQFHLINDVVKEVSVTYNEGCC